MHTHRPHAHPFFFVTATRETPFTRYNRLSNGLYNRLDNRLYRVNKHPTGCQTGLTTWFDNRLYRVNGASNFPRQKCASSADYYFARGRGGEVL